MLLRRLAVARKFVQPGAARRQRRHLQFWSWALLTLVVFQPAYALAGELDFSVIRVETHRAFQQYDGFQLATLAQTSGANIRVNRLEDRIKRHTHPSSHHFLYFIKGQIELSVGAETRVVGEGDFVTIPRGIPHSMRNLGESEAVFLDVASPPDVGDVVWHE